MTKKEKFTIQAINSKSPYLKQVIELGDQNSATLGLLPRIAYKKAADNENILICISSNKELVGYLFYNVNHRKNIVKLNYLCIKEEWRGQGIARLLIDKLQEKTQKLSGIALSCRRDYNLNQFWASLGFTVKSERKGRKKDGSILTEWRFDYGHDDLLTKLTQQNTESKVIAVIDSNIFFDLMDRTRFDEDSKESKALLSDWLASEVELCITDEINNEINRNEDQQQRQKSQEIANSYAFTSLVYDREKFENNCKSLSRFFPDDSKMKESDYSDLRHLAKAIASQHNVQFFITRDTRLLDEIEEDIYQKFNIRIIRPVDFIVKLDELWREAEYQPRQLAGTKLEQRKIKSQEINSTTEEFLNNAQGEKKVDFKRTLRQLLGQVELVEGFFIIRDQEKIGFIIYDRQDENELRIPIFRFFMKQKQIKSTLIRHFLLEVISTSANEGRTLIRISEPFLDEEIINALQEDYFLKVDKDWIKMSFKIAQEASQIADNISILCDDKRTDYSEFSELSTLLKKEDYVQDSEQMFKLEKLLYPAKIIDAEIPTFIVPIQYWYAKNLFDGKIAQQLLFGATEDTIFKRESVYYKSKYASGGLKTPARILWYVSKSSKDTEENRILNLQSIRACSRLDEIIIDVPKSVYKRFRRLGVFTFQQVLKVAKDDQEKQIMALKFSDTELFEQPIELKELREIIPSLSSLQAPQKISNEAFIMIYNKGRNLS